jgi:hypothetical protein
MNEKLEEATKIFRIRLSIDRELMLRGQIDYATPATGPVPEHLVVGPMTIAAAADLTRDVQAREPDVQIELSGSFSRLPSAVAMRGRFMRALMERNIHVELACTNCGSSHPPGPCPEK